LIGVEIREDSGPARPFCYALKKHGLLCKETHVQTIRFAPPLVVGRDDLARALDTIAAVIGAPS
jgi:ornithine--oxo-acid transaminase